MGAFVHPKLTELKNGKLVTGLTKKVCLPVFVDSTYCLGYIFGSFLACGVANLTDYKKSTRGITIFKPKVGYEYDYEKLSNCIYEVFGLKTSVRDRFLYVYSVALTKLLKEFGVNKGKHLPKKYYVNHEEYNDGLLNGMQDFHVDSPDIYTSSTYKRPTSKFVTELFFRLQERKNML